jgi:hypothetical protein
MTTKYARTGGLIPPPPFARAEGRPVSHSPPSGRHRPNPDPRRKQAIEAAFALMEADRTMSGATVFLPSGEQIFLPRPRKRGRAT